MTESHSLPQYVFPLLAKSPNKADDLDILSQMKHFHKLSVEDQLRVGSNHTAVIIQKIQIHEKLTNTATEYLAFLVQEYFFGKIQKKDLIPYLERNKSITQVQAQHISKLLMLNIIEANISLFVDKKDVSLDEAKIKKTKKTLSKALSFYPQINHQIISKSKLTLSTEKDLVSGTVKNWIYDYRDKIESSKRGAIERGKYLFNSANAKALSAEDRQKVSVVLKSHDENTPLIIDTTNKLILFPQIQPRSADINKASPPTVQGSSISKIHSNAAFTLPQKNEKVSKKSANPPLRKPSKTVRQVTQSPKKAHVVGTEDEMTFTSPHALPSEREKQEKDKTPFHMKPIGSGK